MSTQEWKKSNPDKVKAARKKHYEKNKLKIQENIRIRELEFRKWFREIKSQYTCSNCSESHPACIDFHHINPAEKEINLSHAGKYGWSKQRTLSEISKCIPLCSNCHRKLHDNLI